MRRKPGALLPIELSILDTALEMAARGVAEFHGFLLAGEIAGHSGARTLTAYGTLYKALDRMERAGLLTSRWEDISIAEAENRPRRRLYQITAAGEEAAVAARVPSGPVTESARA